MPLWEKMKKALVGEASKPSEKLSPAKSAGETSAGEVPRAHVGDAALGSGPYRRIRIEHGPGGWGGPLTIEPRQGRDLIYSVTGGGIHPVAQKIAELTGGKPFDGFSSKAKFEEIAVAVIDCGGTARVGVYPMKNVPTVDIYPTTPSGPLVKFITEKIFVSGVRIEDIHSMDA